MTADARAARASAERGGALVAVLLAGALVAAAGLGALLLAQGQVEAARRRAAGAQARATARAAAVAAAGWFEARERGALVDPPAAAGVDRDGRTVDPDGDGTGVAFGAAPSPWNVRYKESRPADLFRPPDGPGPEDVFAGTAEHPDLRLAEDGPGAVTLAALSRALDPAGRRRVVRLALFAPAAGGRPGALCTVEAVVEGRLAGGARVRAAARVDVAAVDWGRADRPVLVAGDARFAGDAGWARGEAVVAGALSAPSATWSAWPAGIPWAGPDRPLRDDADGDGTPDDQDLDGVADFEQWRRAPGPVPDPWWRARVGGDWDGPAAAPGACAAPFPSGPRDTPPRPADKAAERSGLVVRCPDAAPVEPVPAAWVDVARRGPRGAWLADEDPARPGLFRRDGAGPPLALGAVLPAEGGVAVIRAAPARTAPLDLAGDGREGGVAVAGAGLRLRGGTSRDVPDPAPGDPRDGGDALRLAPAGPGCAGFDPAPWAPASDLPPPAAGRPCGTAGRHWVGWIAASGPVEVEGPFAAAGVVRAGALVADGAFGPVRLAAGTGASDPGARPGPPGAPRVLATGLRDVP